MTNLVNMGKIVGVFGLNGWIKIKTSSTMENFDHYRQLRLSTSKNYPLLEIEKSYIKNGIWFVLFKGIDDRTKAEQLVGNIVSVSRDELPATANDEYYWVDLIGLQVINLQQELLGVIEDMMDTGANSVMVVKQDDKTRLIPFVDAYVTDVDMQKKQVIVDWGYDY